MRSQDFIDWKTDDWRWKTRDGLPLNVMREPEEAHRPALHGSSGISAFEGAFHCRIRRDNSGNGVIKRDVKKRNDSEEGSCWNDGVQVKSGLVVVRNHIADLLQSTRTNAGIYFTIIMTILRITIAVLSFTNWSFNEHYLYHYYWIMILTFYF